MDRTFENLLSHMNGICGCFETEETDIKRNKEREAIIFTENFEALDQDDQDKRDDAYKSFCMFRGMEITKQRDIRTLKEALSFYQDI